MILIETFSLGEGGHDVDSIWTFPHFLLCNGDPPSEKEKKPKATFSFVSPSL